MNLINTISRLRNPLKRYKIGTINLAAAAVLYYFGTDAAEMLMKHVGHDMIDILVTKLVRFSYAIIGMILLALSCKPFYHLLDRLTPKVDTEEELGVANLSMGVKIGLCFFGYLIAAGMVISAAITP